MTNVKKIDRIDTITIRKAMMGKENRNSCAFRESAVGVSRYHLRRIAHPVATERTAKKRSVDSVGFSRDREKRSGRSARANVKKSGTAE